VVGGNLSEGEALSVSITVLGEADRPVLRSGARVGDEVWLMGDVGAAAAAFA
jgi:thiamine-monophosphate kinase